MSFPPSSSLFVLLAALLGRIGLFLRGGPELAGDHVALAGAHGNK